jgi:hypothetical protein
MQQTSYIEIIIVLGMALLAVCEDRLATFQGLEKIGTRPDISRNQIPGVFGIETRRRIVGDFDPPVEFCVENSGLRWSDAEGLANG